MDSLSPQHARESSWRRRCWRLIRRRVFKWARRGALIAGGLTGAGLLVIAFATKSFPELGWSLSEGWIAGFLLITFAWSTIGALATALPVGATAMIAVKRRAPGRPRLLIVSRRVMRVAWVVMALALACAAAFTAYRVVRHQQLDAEFRAEIRQETVGGIRMFLFQSDRLPADLSEFFEAGGFSPLTPSFVDRMRALGYGKSDYEAFYREVFADALAESRGLAAGWTEELARHLGSLRALDGDTRAQLDLLTDPGFDLAVAPRFLEGLHTKHGVEKDLLDGFLGACRTRQAGPAFIQNLRAIYPQFPEAMITALRITAESEFEEAGLTLETARDAIVRQVEQAK